MASAVTWPLWRRSRFWQRARREVAAVKPDVLWLAESVHTGFVIDRRQRGLVAQSDGECCV